MRRKISDRTRAQAIAICEQKFQRPFNLCNTLAMEIGADDVAINLAWSARYTVSDDEWRWLEASGLLRDGWCPGDPVVRR